MAPRQPHDLYAFDDAAPGNPHHDEIEIQQFLTGDVDEDQDGPEHIVISDDEDEDDGDEIPTPPVDVPFPEVIELPRYQIKTGSVIRKGDTVELEDRTGRVANYALSGDFLRVYGIFENLETGEVSFKGYRLRRCSYLPVLFDSNLNELFMLIQASENDRRPLLEQGMETISVTEVIKKRRCEYTCADYKGYNSRQANDFTAMRAGSKTSKEIWNWIFANGALICRWMHTVICDHNKVSYSGEVRKLYRRETDDASTSPYPAIPAKPTNPGHVATFSSFVSSSKKRHASLEITNASPTKRRTSLPERYTFGDVFSGIGGASEGAQQAGLSIKWGLEKDEKAIIGYAKNFRDARHFLMDAHDFPAMVRRCEHGVDILHLSCPCCYWSVAHTNAGKNDQANMETLYTVGAFLKALKPRYATLEQAPGLLKLKKHNKFFRVLINHIISAKYNVRWKITDQSEYGVPQRRPRLIFICAKEGLPIPAFPRPVHGPKGSGLAHWVTVGDALQDLQTRVDPLDRYHMPEAERPLAHPREPIDPFTILARCITTNGGDNVHPSGTRNYTPRELAQLQGFPANYHFHGSRGAAKKQAGNAWAPTANKCYFLLLAQFLEAWDLGLIDAEADVNDLYDYLEDNNVRIPESTRYLRKLTKSAVSKKKHPLWGSTYKIDAAPRQGPMQQTVSTASAPRQQAPVHQAGRNAAPPAPGYTLRREGDKDFIVLD